MIEEMRDERQDMDRLMVIVYTGTERLPEVDPVPVVQNVRPGPAKGISFEFSAPVGASDGSALSGLPLFERGLSSLAPGSRIDFHWGDLGDLLPFHKDNG